MTLDALIDDAAKRGLLPGLTLWPSERGWQANLRRPGSASTFRVEIEPTPAAALRAVLTEIVPGAEAPAPPSAFD